MTKITLLISILGLSFGCGTNNATRLELNRGNHLSADSGSTTNDKKTFYGAAWNIQMHQEKTSNNGKNFQFWAMDLKSEGSTWTPLEIDWQSSKHDRFFLKIEVNGSTSGIFAELTPNKLTNYSLHPDSDLLLPGEFYDAFDQKLISDKHFQVVDVLTPKTSKTEKIFKIYCTEDKGAAKGLIFENMQIVENSREFYLSDVVLGIGDLTQNGDGTASEGIFYRSGNRVVKETRKKEMLATSTEWKTAKAFPLTIEAKDAVLYLRPTDIQTKSDFVGRMKFLESKKNHALRCNKI
jgi:hypothetical protein